jgi:hypothetical protein
MTIIGTINQGAEILIMDLWPMSHVGIPLDEFFQMGDFIKGPALLILLFLSAGDNDHFAI